MAVGIYLLLKDVPGECAAQGFENQIQLTGFKVGAKNATSVGTNLGMGAGKVSFKTLKVTKAPDAATPLLFQGVCAGQHFENAKISLVKAGSPQAYLRLTLRLVFLSSWDLEDTNQNEIPTETIDIDYGLIEVEYFKQTPKGDLTSSGKRGWDLLKNVKI